MQTPMSAARAPLPPGDRIERRSFFLQDSLARRVAAEYEEMPGLRLTLAQARRLFALPTDVCIRVLDDLVMAGVLRRDETGAYALNGAQA